MNTRKVASITRYAILILILILVSFQFFAHLLGNKLYPGVHGICPFGGLESLYLYIFRDGATLPKIFSGSMGLFFITVIIILLFRRSFCGMICPLGTLQEIFSLPGRLLFKGKIPYTLPQVIDRPLRYLKYLFLFLIIAMTILTGTLWFQSFDPWTAYAHILQFEELLQGYLIGFIILLVSLIGSIFVDRFFCKYACPMGAFNAILGKLIPYRIKRDKDLCTSCGLCTIECPVQIQVEEADEVKSAECINCDKCVHVCPVEGALVTKFWGKRLNPMAAILIVVLIYFAGIAAFQFLGYDRYSGRTELTLREIAKKQNITPAEFKKQYGLPSSFPDSSRSSKIKDSVPFFKMAEMNRTTTAEMRKVLELPDTLTDDMKWGDVFGEVKLSVLSRLNNITVDEYIAHFELGPKVNGDTKWKSVRKKVERFSEKKESTTGDTCGSCESN